MIHYKKSIFDSTAVCGAEVFLAEYSIYRPEVTCPHCRFKIELEKQELRKGENK